MNPLEWSLRAISRWRGRLARYRTVRRWDDLRRRGMHIGDDVLLPPSTWIDVPHCYLISIGDHTGFGEQCMLLAHDAQMDEYLDAARIGRILIHESCHIGAKTIVLGGVEMGPRTLVGAGSVVSRSLPPDSVCAGSPAKVIASLDDYLDRHRRMIEERPGFDYQTHGLSVLPLDRRREILEAVASGDAYIRGGRSAELAGTGGTLRTTAASPPPPDTEDA